MSTNKRRQQDKNTFFSKLIGGGGGQGMKSAQTSIKILLKSGFSSDLTHFLAIIGGPGTPKEI